MRGMRRLMALAFVSNLVQAADFKTNINVSGDQWWCRSDDSYKYSYVAPSY